MGLRTSDCVSVISFKFNYTFLLSSFFTIYLNLSTFHVGV